MSTKKEYLEEVSMVLQGTEYNLYHAIRYVKGLEDEISALRRENEELKLENAAIKELCKIEQAEERGARAAFEFAQKAGLATEPYPTEMFMKEFREQRGKV